MKQSITKLFSLLFFISIFSSCSKPDLDTPNPRPVPPPVNNPIPGTSGSLRFQAIIDLTGQPYHSSNLFAVVSIAKSNGEEVIKEKTLSLDLSSPVKTAAIELPEGNYKLTSFRMVYGSVNTHFATPFAGSAKATGVQKPLMLDFKVSKNQLNEIPVEVLKVMEGEKPQLYGYPSGAFDNGQADASPFVKIKMKAIMKIGDVVYDSIPASLTITSWKDNGEKTTAYGSLKAGVNEIQLLKSATKFDIVVSKWGTNDAITINRQDVDENQVYILGGSKTAKKLSSEIVLKIVDGKDVPDTKTNYFYDHNGNLLKIDYWMKKADQSNFLSKADFFSYEAGRLSKIKTVNVSNNTIIKEISFSYNAQGKITNMKETANGFNTTAAITYLPSQQNMGIQFNLASGHTMNHNMDLHKGNVIYTSTSNSNGTFMEVRNSYDANINPYHHLNFPTLFLDHSSKNNITSRQNQANYSITEPYSFFYKYDADGYPVEVIKNYMSYPSGNFAYATKTVFVY